jgi:hypothetical protein
VSSELRVCSRCHVAKALGEFPIKNGAKGWYGSHCRPCRREYGRQHYRDNLDYYKRKAGPNRTRDRDANRTLIQGFLRVHPCVDCGECDPVVLDFDHVDPALKTATVGRLAHAGGSKQLAAEIAKCVVRCGNCHRRRTAIQFGWYRIWLAAVE